MWSQRLSSVLPTVPLLNQVTKNSRDYLSTRSNAIYSMNTTRLLCKRRRTSLVSRYTCHRPATPLYLHYLPGASIRSFPEVNRINLFTYISLNDTIMIGKYKTVDGIIIVHIYIIVYSLFHKRMLADAQFFSKWTPTFQTSENQFFPDTYSIFPCLWHDGIYETWSL